MTNQRKERRQAEQERKPRTPPELDAAVKRIFAYGPLRKRKGERVAND